MCLFNILYSESCVERIQQFKIVTYMAHRNIHTSIQPKNLGSWSSWWSYPDEYNWYNPQNSVPMPQNLQGGSRAVTFWILQLNLRCVSNRVNGGLSFPSHVYIGLTPAGYEPSSDTIWVRMQISAGHHDERNESVALGDLSGIPSAADLRGIPSAA